MKTVSKTTYLLILFSLLFLSCNKKEIIYKKEMYSVFSSIYIKEAKGIIVKGAFQPKPPKPDADLSFFENRQYSKNDSLEIFENWFKKAGKSVISIYPNTIQSYPFLDNITCEGFADLLKYFILNKEELDIDFSKIKNSKYASIEKFESVFLDAENRDFHIIYSFSPVSFNKKYDKAIVRFSATWGKLTGYSKVYFLEKKEGKWVVKCEDFIGSIK
jgi:hypothetical protein